MNTKTLQVTVSFNAPASVIYETLMDSRKHAALTNTEAIISNEVGATFTAGGGYINGKNLELIPHKEIIQTWRAVNWPEDFFSIIRYSLQDSQQGCELAFTHANIPEEHFEAISAGWDEHYWQPLKRLSK